MPVGDFTGTHTKTSPIYSFLEGLVHIISKAPYITINLGKPCRVASLWLYPKTATTYVTSYSLNIRSLSRMSYLATGYLQVILLQTLLRLDKCIIVVDDYLLSLKKLTPTNETVQRYTIRSRGRALRGGMSDKGFAAHDLTALLPHTTIYLGCPYSRNDITRVYNSAYRTKKRSSRNCRVALQPKSNAREFSSNRLRFLKISCPAFWADDKRFQPFLQPKTYPKPRSRKARSNAV
ncbi:hypothetical protein GGR53DRAFT_472995, partial [Hypoxylon sp. FL1150]